MDRQDTPQDYRRERFLDIMESSKKTVNPIVRYTLVVIMLTFMVSTIVIGGLAFNYSPDLATSIEFLMSWSYFAVMLVSFVGINEIAIDMVLEELKQNKSPDDALDFAYRRILGGILVSIVGIFIIPLFEGSPELESAMPGLSSVLILVVFVGIGMVFGGALAIAHLIFRKRTL